MEKIQTVETVVLFLNRLEYWVKLTLFVPYTDYDVTHSTNAAYNICTKTFHTKQNVDGYPEKKDPAGCSGETWVGITTKLFNISVFWATMF